MLLLLNSRESIKRVTSSVIIAATAPASCARIALETNEHSPRSISTILPLVETLSYQVISWDESIENYVKSS